jgi:hypothetical protein
MSEEFFTSIETQVIAGLILAGILGSAGFITALYRCVKNQDKRSWRQSQAILTLAETQDEVTRILHPKEDKLPTALPKVQRQLKDGKGNL